MTDADISAGDAATAVPATDRDATIAAFLGELRRQAGGRDPSERLRLCCDLHDGLDAGGDVGTAAPGLATSLKGLSREDQDYCVATGYALMMTAAERQSLGVYLTPPPLVDALLAAMEAHGLDLGVHSVIDPAAGGAAFVVPLARRILRLSEGRPASERLEDLKGRLQGTEIEPGLGSLANRMVRRVVRDALGRNTGLGPDEDLVNQGDALRTDYATQFDAVIGNPPYGRLSRDQFAVWKDVYPEISDNGHLNWYAIFVRRALDLLRPGGLLGFIIPTSFVGSPSYEGFRRNVCEMAEVLRIDHIDQRQGLFVSVQQDCCILILRRHVATDVRPVACKLGYLSDGISSDGGECDLATDGKAWRMACGPIPASRRKRTTSETCLAKIGWKGRVGSVVPHRNGDNLFDAPAGIDVGEDRAVIRVIWSKAITSDGHFDASRMDDLPQTYALCRTDSPSLIKRPCLIIQRTSNKLQRRRINTTVLPEAFLGSHGVLAENHVVVLSPPEGTAPDMLPLWARLLSSQRFDQLFKERSGTVTVSVRLLLDLPFPASWVPSERPVPADGDSIASNADDRRFAAGRCRTDCSRDGRDLAVPAL